MNVLSTPTIYLHIGCEKTGSTYLQNYLITNRERLLSEGFLYFDQFESWNLLSYLECKRGDAAFRNSTHGRDWFEAFCQSIRDFRGDIIISQENFWAGECLYLEEFKEIFSDYQFVVIVYIRNQVEWLESWYQETIKQVAGFDKRFAEWELPLEYVDYSKRLMMWKELFDNRVVIRLFDRETLFGGDICSDFLKVIGYQADTALLRLPDTRSSNRRLSLRTLEVMRNLNCVFSGHTRDELFQLLISNDKSQVDNSGDYTVLDENSLEKIHDYYREPNHDLFAMLDEKNIWSPSSSSNRKVYRKQDFEQADVYRYLAENLLDQQRSITQLRACLEQVLNRDRQTSSGLINRVLRQCSAHQNNTGQPATASEQRLASLSLTNFHVEPLKDVSHVEIMNGVLEVVAVGNDPQVLFTSDVTLQARCALLEVEISAPVATVLDIFPLGREQKVHLDQRQRVNIPQGFSRNYLVLDRARKQLSFRLDPGEAQGRYRIYRLRVY